MHPSFLPYRSQSPANGITDNPDHPWNTSWSGDSRTGRGARYESATYYRTISDPGRTSISRSHIRSRHPNR